jgi:GT2 family glycosyltransferase
VNYNGAHLLPECLESLKTQEHRNLEVIVVDNGSVDESKAVAGRYECTFVGLGVNAGLPAAYNRGAELASGEYLFFVNNDMRFDRACIRALAGALDATPDAFAADPLQYDWDGTRIIHALARLERTTTVREMLSTAVIPVPPLKMNYVAQAAAATTVPWGCAGCLMVRRSRFEALSGWDESFFIDMEDVDLCWRAWLRGWPTVFVAAAVLHHKVGASNDEPLRAAKRADLRERISRRDFSRLVRQQRNHLRFAVKVLDPLSVAVLVAMKVVRGVVLVPQRPRVAFAIARALAMCAFDLPESLSQRRRIARESTCSSRALIQRFSAPRPSRIEA